MRVIMKMQSFLWFDQWKDIPMDPWFGATYRRLIKALFDFFYTHFSLRLEMMTKRDPLVDYEEFISSIKDAITRLEDSKDK